MSAFLHADPSGKFYKNTVKDTHITRILSDEDMMLNLVKVEYYYLERYFLLVT